MSDFAALEFTHLFPPRAHTEALNKGLQALSSQPVWPLPAYPWQEGAAFPSPLHEHSLPAHTHPGSVEPVLLALVSLAH